MKITLLTYGSQGDVEPFIALAERLIEAGHQVMLAAPEIFSSFLDDSGIDFIGLPGDPGMMVDTLVDQAGKNPLRMVSSMSNFIYPLAVDVYQKVMASCREADLVVHSFLMTSTGYELARELGVNDLSVQLFPVFTTTADFPAPAFPFLPLGPAYNRFTHNVITWIFWNGSQFIYRRAQKSNPGLPDLTGWPFDPKNPHQSPILYAFSPQVVPHPGDWPDNVFITGYWIRQFDQTWHPDPELLEFLEEGPPPVAVVFGSTSTFRMKEIQEKIIQALIAVDQRGIFVGVDPGQTQTIPGFLFTSQVPYQWLFDRSSAAIHHGGAGTSARAFISGIPQITLPFTSDQPFWGRRIAQLGVGPKPLSPKRFTTVQLIKAIRSSLADTQIKTAAEKLGKMISQENGLTRAVEIIESCLSESRS